MHKCILKHGIYKYTDTNKHTKYTNTQTQMNIQTHTWASISLQLKYTQIDSSNREIIQINLIKTSQSSQNTNTKSWQFSFHLTIGSSKGQ